MKESDIRNPCIHERYLELVREDAGAFFGDSSRLEDTPCPACRARKFRAEFVKFGFTYGSCEDCRTLYVNPRPKIGPLTDFYVKSPSSRFWVEEFFKPVAEARREKMFRPRAQHVAGLLPDLARETIGDIGAGYGLFLEELRRLWPEGNFMAIEPSPEMAAICRAKKLGVAEVMIEDLEGADGSFALLTAFELLEHLHTPETMVRKAFQLLKPGGYFLATTLSGEGFDIQVLWEKSRSVFPPHHLNFLNPDSLAGLCRRAGFDVQAAETPGVLDWQIVEGTLQRNEAEVGRFWATLSRNGSAEAKQDLQAWITKHRFSSHMRVLAQKPSS
ncbi:MAG: class I SAM-dependent methyltransferase [Opitutaceae bacterium]|nr:class I SAM-dependent methyltransferase [Opitutaceae bacterium]